MNNRGSYGRGLYPINGMDDVFIQTRQINVTNESNSQPVSVQLSLERFLNNYLTKLLEMCGKKWNAEKNNQGITIKEFCHYLSIYMIKYKINTPIRQAMFLAQAIAETGFTNMKEDMHYTKKAAENAMERYQNLGQAIKDYQQKYENSDYYKNSQNNTKNKDFFEEYNNMENDVNKKQFIEKILGTGSEKFNAIRMLNIYKNIDNNDKKQMADFIAIYGYNGYYGRGLKQLTWYQCYKEFEDEVNGKNKEKNIKFCGDEKNMYSYKNKEWIKVKKSGFYLEPDEIQSKLPDNILKVQYAVWSACWYFSDRCINKGNGCVDNCNIARISLLINGGENWRKVNGIEKRFLYSKNALQIMSTDSNVTKEDKEEVNKRLNSVKATIIDVIIANRTLC